MNKTLSFMDESPQETISSNFLHALYNTKSVHAHVFLRSVCYLRHHVPISVSNVKILTHLPLREHDGQPWVNSPFMYMIRPGGDCSGWTDSKNFFLRAHVVISPSSPSQQFFPGKKNKAAQTTTTTTIKRNEVCNKFRRNRDFFLAGRQTFNWLYTATYRAISRFLSRDAWVSHQPVTVQ